MPKPRTDIDIARASCCEFGQTGCMRLIDMGRKETACKPSECKYFDKVVIPGFVNQQKEQAKKAGKK